MEIVSNIALISINETLVVQLISFLIFLYVINRIMFRPIRKVMGERDNYIKKINLDIEDAQKEFDHITHQIGEKESAIKLEAYALKEQLEESGRQKAEEIFAAARQEIAEVKKKTEKEVEAQIQDARQYIKAESEILSQTIMEKVLDRRLAP
jgi:F-type H+-transporting ATPase subunit b